MPSIRVGETFSYLHFGQNDVDLSIYKVSAKPQCREEFLWNVSSATLRDEMSKNNGSALADAQAAQSKLLSQTINKIPCDFANGLRVL